MSKPFCTLAVTERQPDGSSETVSYIPLDVRERSNLSFSSQVSDNPVESGSNIADHVIKAPVRFSLSGLVSETPVGIPGSASTGQVLPGTRAMSCYQALQRAWDKSSPLEVVMELGVFEDMQIVALDFPRDRDRGGNAVWFDLEIQQVTVVESQSASLPPDVVSKIKRRRAVTKNKETQRQKDLKARTAKETSTGKTSTSTYSDATATGYTSDQLSTTYARL